MDKILTIVKPTGYNFIRHYFEGFPKGSQIAHNEDRAFELMPGFKIVLLEWANDLTANIINSPKFHKLQQPHNFTTIVRIHDHEVRKIYSNGRRIDHINWDRVDKIWFINPIIRSQFHELKGCQDKTFFIPNAVSSTLFPEHCSEEKKVGITSLSFRKRKRIDRIAPLAKLLPDWEFHIRVEVPPFSANSEFRNEFEKFRDLAQGLDNIVIHDRPTYQIIKNHYDTSDYINFWKDKAVALSLSDWEGFGYNIAEPMMMGKMPVVWSWPGAEFFWKPYTCSSIEQMAEKIRDYKPSYKYRRYVMDNYNPKDLTIKLIKKINKDYEW